MPDCLDHNPTSSQIAWSRWSDTQGCPVTSPTDIVLFEQRSGTVTLSRFYLAHGLPGLARLLTVGCPLAKTRLITITMVPESYTHAFSTYITLITHKYGVAHYSISSIYIYNHIYICIIVCNIYRIQFIS